MNDIKDNLEANERVAAIMQMWMHFKMLMAKHPNTRAADVDFEYFLYQLTPNDFNAIETLLREHDMMRTHVWQAEGTSDLRIDLAEVERVEEKRVLVHIYKKDGEYLSLGMPENRKSFMAMWKAYNVPKSG